MKHLPPKKFDFQIFYKNENQEMTSYVKVRRCSACKHFEKFVIPCQTCGRERASQPPIYFQIVPMRTIRLVSEDETPTQELIKLSNRKTTNK